MMATLAFNELMIKDSMYIIHSVLSCKCATRFLTFSVLFFQTKMVNHCECYVTFNDIKYQLQEDILHHFYHYDILLNLH